MFFCHSWITCSNQRPEGGKVSWNYSILHIENPCGATIRAEHLQPWIMQWEDADGGFIGCCFLLLKEGCVLIGQDS
jgi:hypothetical protein